MMMPQKEILEVVRLKPLAANDLHVNRGIYALFNDPGPLG